LLKTQIENEPKSSQSNRQKPEITSQAYQSRVLRSLHLVQALSLLWRIRRADQLMDLGKHFPELVKTGHDKQFKLALPLEGVRQRKVFDVRHGWSAPSY
ncbi:hypothetical protein, partial [Gluconobacter oxydans]|uniref:hypothetical protein n=1 Tax=Gluconobacter oxydans TaxID=442 RepID=UPI001D178B8A